MSNKINIIMAINEKFIFPTRVTIASLIANKKDELIDIYILHFNISNKGVKLLESDSTNDVKIKCIKINQNEIPDVKIYFEFSKEIMIKLFAHRYLSDDINKVIWLDSDIIVLKSLDNLYKLNIDNYIYIAYEDQKVKKFEYTRLNLPDDYRYFNVGIMLMNINKMRCFEYEKKIINYLERCEIELTYPEQDLGNVLFGVNGEVKILGFPYTYNRFVDMVHKQEICKQNIAILHYVGFHQKPWKGCACRHYFVWWKYAWDIKEYRILFFKVLPTYIINLVKKVFVKIGLILGINKKHK